MTDSKAEKIPAPHPDECECDVCGGPFPTNWAKAQALQKFMQDAWKEHEAAAGACETARKDAHLAYNKYQAAREAFLDQVDRQKVRG